MRLFRIALLLALALPGAALANVKAQRQGTGGIEYDAPRTSLALCSINFTAATSEGMITLTPVRDLVAGGTGTTFAVTASKRMRIVGACLSTKNAGAAVQGVQIRIRAAPSGSVTTASPAIGGGLGAGTSVATANVVGSTCQIFDDDNGIELSGTAQIGVSQIGTATAGNDFCMWGYEF